jgi:tetratricopeptide (TPR) repeat protein
VDALRVLERAGATVDQFAVHAEAARIQLATADVYLTAGLFSEAGIAAAAAAQRTLAQGMVHDSALATYTLALAHLGSRNFDAAARELGRAAELLDRVGDRQYRSRAVLAQAELADQRGQRTAARLADAADLINELGYAYELRHGRLYRREGRESEAESLLRSAAAAAEELVSGLPDAAFRASKLDAHDELLNLLVARGRPEDLGEACRIGDRGKARTLIELATATIGSRSLRPGTSAPSTLLLDQRCADLSAVYDAMAAAEQSAQPRLWRRAAELEHEISALRLQRALEVPPGDTLDGPAAGSVGYLPTTPTLAFHVAGETVIAFVLRAGQVQARRIGGVLAAVAVELDRLVAQWSRFRVGTAFTRRNQTSLLATTKDSLGALYRLLVAPVKDLLGGLDDPNLVVIPHRTLHRVPFHILHDGTGYLCEQRTITLRPTITRVRPSSTPRPVHGTLVFAVPDTLVPSITAEARALATVMPDARVVLGSDASTQRLRAELPGPAVLHLACHGLYRSANPLFSALRLADRWVNAAEILDLDLGGALVTLSACESGRPSRDSAEQMGLASAFLAAGASGVVASQWLIDDDATSVLMPAMYAGLADGLGPAEALRQAQLTAAARFPHPYYWGSFVYVESPSAERLRDIDDQAQSPGTALGRGRRRFPGGNR